MAELIQSSGDRDMLHMVKKLDVKEVTLGRLLTYREGFESADDVLNKLIDLAEEALTARGTPLGMIGVTFAQVARSKQKPATWEQLQAAITTALKARGGEYMYQQIVEDVRLLLPEHASHPHFKTHVTYAATRMRKEGKLQNGHDHGTYGLWKLT
jgi:hypothetical protein